MEIKINEIYNQFNCNTKKKKITIKQLIAVFKKYNICKTEKQKYFFTNFDLFVKIYYIFEDLSQYFDYITYGIKESYAMFFEYLYLNLIENKNFNIIAIFCPGYEGNGYKDKAGKTTREKLKIMGNIKTILESKGIKATFNMIYADVFLENTDIKKIPNLIEQLEFNKQCFINEGLQYFQKSELIFLSEQKEFKAKENFEGYIIDATKYLKTKTINTFNNDNIRFYTSLNWSNDRIIKRTNILLTLYLKVCFYIKENYQNPIYLPMENMYLRTIIFEQMGICSLYLHYDKAQ